MTTPVIVTGDDVALAVTLKKDGATFDMTGANVSAALITTDHATQLIADTAQSEVAVGADYANSLVIVEFPAAATGAVTDDGDALLEVQVDDGSKLTWFSVVSVKLGTVA